MPVELSIERSELLPLVRDVSSGFTRVSTIVGLSDGWHDGDGEDIRWDQIDQIEFLRARTSAHLVAGDSHVRRVLAPGGIYDGRRTAREPFVNAPWP
jgi:hypothetical protein